MQIHITSFVRRQTPKSAFTHWEFDDAELLKRVYDNFKKKKSGYREGVELVPIDPDGVYTGVVTLNPGDLMVGEYTSRRDGEDPRKSIYSVNGNKIPAQSAFVVLYRHDVLAENKENETDADYEIVSINGSPTLEEQPIAVSALIANHFQLSGGTSTKMSDSEFVEALRISVNFWKDKSLIAPEHLRNHDHN